MGEVKTSELRIGDNPALSPGEYLRYLREARRGPRMDGQTSAKGRATAEDNAIAEALLEAFAHTVLAADPVRTQALELVESLATLLEEWHTDFGDECAGPGVVAHESELIAKARKFVRKAREASKP